MDDRNARRDLTAQLDWGRFASLRLRARTVAEGVYAGAHRSVRRGPGVEFGGHRAYVPGDDLRWIDRHALLRHDRLIVREFETETDRALHLMVDATRSMGFCGEQARESKLDYAALLATALARVALASGDPVSLSWLGGSGIRPIAPISGGEAFERVVRALCSIRATGDLVRDPRSFERAVAPIARRARRGAIIILLSDLVDLPVDACEHFCALGVAGRRLVVVQVLDPDEMLLPYEHTARLRAMEGDAVVETDPDLARPAYLAAMNDLRMRWSQALARRAGRLLGATTNDDAVGVVSGVIQACAERVA